MSEAVNQSPRQQRGPVAMQHPLELPIDPETGDPVLPQGAGGKQKPKQERLPGKDRFGLTPPPKGYFRGYTDNVVRTSRTTPIGELVTMHFDLVGEDDQRLPIEFVGYTFSKDIRQKIVAETYIGSKFPTERLRRDRLRLSFDPNSELRAYMPVQKRFGSFGKDRRLGVAAIIAPIVVILLITWLFVHLLHAG